MLRRISDSQGGTVQVSFREWSRSFFERKAELALWEEGALARAAAVAQRAKAVAMGMGASDKGLIQEVYQTWREVHIYSLAMQKSRAHKDHAMKAASQSILKAQATLKQSSFQ